MQSFWWVTRDGDLDCHDLYMRHYSAHRYLDDRRATDKRFSGPGEKIVLRTLSGNAMFVWRRFVDDCIDQRTGHRQAGVNCAVFRNESEHLSSDLVRQADAVADALWTDRRHYTYVSSEKVASRNPGFCFLKAGWQRCGKTKGGLIVLERYSKDYESDSKMPNGLQTEARNPLISNDILAEWTGLEPATPGVTGR